jgi:hypothetical protein
MRIVVVVVSVLVLAVAGSAHGATQGCDVASATPLVQEPDTNPRVVRAVHCGAFLGPGSEAMIAVMMASQDACHNVMGWRVFARVDGGWQSTGTLHPAGDLRVEGTTIIERRVIHRRADWFCSGATGGEQERSWAWNGTALAAGAWTQTVPARPKGEVARLPRGSGISFFVARQPILCVMVDDEFVFAHCEWRRDPLLSTVRLSASGRLRTCKVSRSYGCNIGNPGEDDFTSTLRTGQSVIVGRFRCRAQRVGMRCTVIRSGKGFVLDRRGPRAIR